MLFNIDVIILFPYVHSNIGQNYHHSLKRVLSDVCHYILNVTFIPKIYFKSCTSNSVNIDQNEMIKCGLQRTGQTVLLRLV